MSVKDRDRTLLRLEQTLSAFIPESRYCIDASQRDGCMVLTQDGEQWIVYFREGLLIEDVTVHDTLEEAALQLIRNVAPSPEAEDEMKKRFLS